MLYIDMSCVVIWNRRLTQSVLFHSIKYTEWVHSCGKAGAKLQTEEIDYQVECIKIFTCVNTNGNSQMTRQTFKTHSREDSRLFT